MGYAVKGFVRGRVQGVGFRAFVKNHALERKLTGSATNLDDGRVEVILQGIREEVNEVQHLVSKGPSTASVIAISWELIEVFEQDGFVIN